MFKAGRKSVNIRRSIKVWRDNLRYRVPDGAFTALRVVAAFTAFALVTVLVALLIPYELLFELIQDLHRAARASIGYVMVITPVVLGMVAAASVFYYLEEPLN